MAPFLSLTSTPGLPMPSPDSSTAQFNRILNTRVAENSLSAKWEQYGLAASGMPVRSAAASRNQLFVMGHDAK